MNKSLYEYADKIDDNKHISFYDVFKTLLKNIDCIICLESAADLLGYSNGGFRSKISIYTNEFIDLPYLDCHVTDLSKIPYMEYYDLKVTPINDTIVDLLKDDKSDSQIITETLANYYFEHNESYVNIKVPNNLDKKFNMYKKEGQRYYDTY